MPTQDAAEVKSFKYFIVITPFMLKEYYLPFLLLFQQMQSQSIIIIHPGSQNLRIGRASDLSPHLILHAVSRRRLRFGSKHEDYLLPPRVHMVSQKIVQAIVSFFTFDVFAFKYPL